MDKAIPVIKNEEYIIDIEGLGYEGEGVGKLEGFTIFVEGALISEKVKIKILKVHKNYAYGKLLEIIESSKERVEPPCSIYKKCGGCQLQHLSYEGQLEFKKQRVMDCITKIAKLDSNLVKDTIGMQGSEFRYRNKVQLPVAEETGEIKVGFYAKRSHNIIQMDTCLIQTEIADKAARIIKAWIIKNKISVYNEETNQGFLRHIMIRQGFTTKQVMVVLVTTAGTIDKASELIEVLVKNIEGLKSVIQNINDKNTNVVLGQKCRTLWGSDLISDNIGEFKFNISPLSFFQVNPRQTKVLYDKSLEFADLTGEETVFDAYCGTGTISLFLSQKAKKVYGVEIVPEAIENAIENAKNNGVENAEFYVGESERVIPELLAKGIRPQVVVVDPPRKGCEKILLQEIAKAAPRTIVYVSCDPSTLARDLAVLTELDYEVVQVQPVDMFPSTAHVETVVKLERR